MKVRNFVALGTLALAVATVAGCNNSLYGSGGGCTPTTTQVCMVNTAFSPLTLTVTAGSTVRWQNGDGITHSVTTDAGSAETFSTDVGAGNSTSHQYNTPGTYNYHCRFHGSAGAGMHGTITVNP